MDFHDDHPKDPFQALDGDTDHAAIYSAFIDKAVLEPEDRESLKKDRGFTDNIIDALKFKSCRPHNVEIIQQLQEAYGQDSLLACGMLECDPETGELRPCRQLLQPNIVIPFFNEKGEIYFIRPHKFGLKNMGIQIYAPYLNFQNTLVITESEFKAAASLCFQIPAIGLPGIHSYAVNNFGRLVEFIRRYPNIKKIIIVFDNEIKDNSSLPNFKTDVTKQWDTQYRAIQMAKQLDIELLNVTTLIGVLPAEWMVDGKIDIDGALAQGRTVNDFRKVIQSALRPEAYLKTLSNTGQRVIRHRLHRLFFKTSIIKKDLCYSVLRYRKKEDDPREERISNFQMKFEKTIIEGTGYVRQVIFKGQDGSISRPYICRPDTIRLSDFKKWAASCGNFIFTGSQDDLDKIFELEFAECSGREIRRPFEIGFLRHEISPVWLFGNCLIKNDGSVLLPDEEGVTWDGLDGYQPRSIKDGAEGDTGVKIPTVNLDPQIKFGLAELREVVRKMHDNFGGNKAIYLGVGWIIACLFSEEIFKRFSCFPLLFIGGKRESGKTALGQWLMALMGFPQSSADSLSNTSRVGIARNLSWYSSLAYWLDEYRNDKIGKAMAGFFRNSYQRQASSKGTLGANIRSEEINAGIILSGEETPEDNAFLSRCLVIPIVRGARKQEIYTEIESFRQKGYLSRLIIEVLKRKKVLVPDILKNIQGLKERLLEKGAGERVALNYSIAAVCFYKIFLDHDMEQSKEWLRWVAEESHRTEVIKESEHMLSIFMEDLVSIREKLLPYFSVFEAPNAVKGRRRIAFHFKSFYSEWTDFYRRKGNEQFKSATMRDYLKDEKYFIEAQKNCRVGPSSTQMRCMILSLDPEDNPPDGLLTIADGSIAVKDNGDGLIAPSAVGDSGVLF